MSRDSETACKGNVQYSLHSLDRSEISWLENLKKRQHMRVEVIAYCWVEFARLCSPDDGSSPVSDSWSCLIEPSLWRLLPCCFFLLAGTPSHSIWTEGVDSNRGSFPVWLRRFRSSNIFISWAVYLRGWWSESRWAEWDKSMSPCVLTNFGN